MAQVEKLQEEARGQEGQVAAMEATTPARLYEDDLDALDAVLQVPPCVLSGLLCSWDAQSVSATCIMDCRPAIWMALQHRTAL